MDHTLPKCVWHHVVLYFSPSFFEVFINLINLYFAVTTMEQDLDGGKSW